MTAPRHAPYPSDVADAINRLVETARKAGGDCARGDGPAAELPVRAARMHLDEILSRIGIDGTGWMPDPVPGDVYAEVERERDSALLEMDRLNGVIYDLQERLAYERERAEHAEITADMDRWHA